MTEKLVLEATLDLIEKKIDSAYKLYANAKEATKYQYWLGRYDSLVLLKAELEYIKKRYCGEIAP